MCAPWDVDTVSLRGKPMDMDTRSREHANWSVHDARCTRSYAEGGRRRRKVSHSSRWIVQQVWTQGADIERRL